jgi:hypothetical protein
MTPQRVFLIQTLLEALIPTIGYFYWNWDLSFILLFYLLDYLLAFGILIAKGRKRSGYSKQADEKKLFLRQSGIGFLLMAAACAGTAIGVQLLHPDMSWPQRIGAFLTYEDMGIQQGYVLVPLILLNGVMVYRQQFLMPARYRVLSMEAITRPFVTEGLVLLGCAGLFIGTASLVKFPEEVVIALLIGGTTAYRYILLRK